MSWVGYWLPSSFPGELPRIVFVHEEEDHAAVQAH